MKKIISTIIQCSAMILIVLLAVYYLHENPMTVTKTITVPKIPLPLLHRLGGLEFNIITFAIVAFVPVVGIILATIECVRDLLILKR